MANYPNEIYEPREKENRSGVVYDPNKKTVIFVEDIKALDEEVVAIEEDLLSRRYSITFVIDGGGSEITPGQKGHLEIPFKCEIERVTLLADQVGSIVIDIWKDTYENFPPTAEDSICGTSKPTISNSRKYQDSTLTGWTKTINAGDILAFNVDSASTITRVTLALKVKKI